MTNPLVAPVLSGSISDLERWASLFTCITVIDVRRTSNKSKKEFAAMLQRGEGGRPDDPDVHRLAGYGHSIVLPAGEALREQLGAFTITRGSVDGSVSRAVLGWAIPIGRTLFILYLESARKFDVAGRTRDQSVNAFAEAFRAIVRGTRPEVVHTPLLSRVFRLIDHAIPVMRTLRVYGAKLYAEGKLIALDSDDEKFLATIQAAMADKDAAQNVARLEGDRLTIYGRGEWYLGRELLPFTWDTEFEMVQDPQSGALMRREVDKHVVIPTERGPELLREFVRLGGTPGVGREQIAIALGRRGVVSRAPKHAGKLVTIDNLRQPRSAIDSLCTREWVTAFRTGWYEKEVEFTSDLRSAYPAAPLRVDEEGRRWLRIRVRMPEPVGGWGVTKKEWSRFEERQFGTTHSSRGGRSQATKGRVRPLLGLSSFATADGQAQRVILGFESSGYQLCERAATLAKNTDGSPRAWGREARWLKTVNTAAWHTSVANALLVLGVELADQIASLTAPEPAPALDGAVDRLSGELAAAQEVLTRLENRVRGIREERQEMRGDPELAEEDRKAEVARLTSDERQARSQLRSAEATVEELRAQVGAAAAGEVVSVPGEQGADADFTSLELVIAALLRYRGTAPASLAHVIRSLVGDTLRWELIAYGTMVAWSATVSLPLRDGMSASRTISGTVPTSRGSSRAHLGKRNSQRGNQLPKRVGGTARSHADAYAKRFFVDGCSLTDIERERGIKASGSSAGFVYRLLREWLLSHGVASMDLARAAVDIPIVETRQALHRALVDDDGTIELDGFSSLVGDVYRNGLPVLKEDGAIERKLSWGVLWCAAPMLKERRVFEVLKGQSIPGSRLSAAIVADRAGVPYTTSGSHRAVGRGLSLLDMTNGGRPRRSRGDVAPSLPLFLGKDWQKRDTRSPEKKSVWLMPCPHAHCRGHLLPVPVPEVSGGLLCDTCLRLPQNDRVIFPSAYLLPWSGGRRRKTSDGTHVGTVLLPST